MSATLVTRVLLGSLTLVAVWYCCRWYVLSRRRAALDVSGHRWPDLLTGLAANFLDTLGISSFATTTAVFKLSRRVSDETIPGTLNVGHALPTLVQAAIFIVAVSVDTLTLISMMIAAIVGAWFGAGIVSRLPRQGVQIGMGAALLCAALVLLASNLQWMPVGGTASGLRGGYLVFAVGANFVLGALMTLGVGLYAPCLILVSVLGMNPLAAFPIMMGSCAFLMPVAAVRFIGAGRYDSRVAIWLTIGGIPGVLIAVYWMKALPITFLRWLVVLVVSYTALLMLSSAWRSARRARMIGDSTSPLV
jgi:uncharacterized membrane protein YfcA